MDSVRIPAWERENFRLNKGNIFPYRKSLVSDIPAGKGETAKPFFTVYVVTKRESVKYCTCISVGGMTVGKQRHTYELTPRMRSNAWLGLLQL
jgi:hypothetical protein